MFYSHCVCFVMLLNNLSSIAGDSKGGGRDWTGECRARSHRQWLELQENMLETTKWGVWTHSLDTLYSTHRQFDVEGYSSKAWTWCYDQAVQANFKLVTQSWSVEYNDERRNRWWVGQVECHSIWNQLHVPREHLSETWSFHAVDGIYWVPTQHMGEYRRW